jgi:hypothetical protein
MESSPQPRYAGQSFNVAALAGRRIDALGSKTERFPLRNCDKVSEALERVLVEERVGRLFCSAACGADLLALQVAKGLGIERFVVLPFSPDRFKEVSVIDRPGNWGPVFDDVIQSLPIGNLIVLNQDESSMTDAFEAATREIVRRAGAAEPHRAVGIVVWEGAPRGGDDATSSFVAHAVKNGFRVRTVLTAGWE